MLQNSFLYFFPFFIIYFKFCAWLVFLRFVFSCFLTFLFLFFFIEKLWHLFLAVIIKVFPRQICCVHLLTYLMTGAFFLLFYFFTSLDRFIKNNTNKNVTLFLNFILCQPGYFYFFRLLKLLKILMPLFLLLKSVIDSFLGSFQFFKNILNVKSYLNSKKQKKKREYIFFSTQKNGINKSFHVYFWCLDFSQKKYVSKSLPLLRLFCWMNEKWKKKEFCFFSKLCWLFDAPLLLSFLPSFF